MTEQEKSSQFCKDAYRSQAKSHPDGTLETYQEYLERNLAHKHGELKRLLNSGVEAPKPVNPPQEEGKVLITGTGRSGTTFLVILLTHLGLDTGFTPKTIDKNIYKHCNAGLESHYTQKHRIIKDPNIMFEIEEIAQTTKIDHVFIPVRHYAKAAQSRVNNGDKQGGLLQAKDKSSQIDTYRLMIAKYVKAMTQYDLPTTFIDFERMTQSSTYLYQKLQPILKDIKLEDYLGAYGIATKHQRK